MEKKEPMSFSDTGSGNPVAGAALLQPPVATYSNMLRYLGNTNRIDKHGAVAALGIGGVKLERMRPRCGRKGIGVLYRPCGIGNRPQVFNHIAVNQNPKRIAAQTAGTAGLGPSDPIGLAGCKAADGLGNRHRLLHHHDLAALIGGVAEGRTAVGNHKPAADIVPARSTEKFKGSDTNGTAVHFFE